jgi:hypothetical protein
MDLTDIHQMTGLLKTSFVQTGVVGKTDHWQMASASRQSGEVRIGSEAEVRQSQHDVCFATDNG